MDVDLEKYFKEHIGRFVEDWKQFLSFASISADPTRENDCRDCANWLAEHLRGMGFQSRLLETGSKPVVFAERKAGAEKPVVLFYGHYDVQPVDPLDEWLSPPFTPTPRNNRLYARGAEDNKGQVFYFLKAVEFLIRHDLLNATVKVIVEGEEENGSRGIASSLESWRDLIKADILVVTDANTVPSGAPTIIMGLRGLIHLSVTLTGPTHDLHSGVHGGAAPNPATELTRLLASLHNTDGSIAVEKFYGFVRAPTERERALANGAAFDPDLYRTKTGVPPTAGEKQFTPPERVGFRPCIDINGIHSGYEGSGMKTIIPAKATAKITARLVPDQDPAACLKAIIYHLRARAPDGLRLDISDAGVAGPGFRLNPDSPVVARAQKALDGLTDKKTVFLWEGASIPVIWALSQAAGAELLLVGFGDEEGRAHAPNESFSLEQFKLGFMYVARLLGAGFP